MLADAQAAGASSAHGYVWGVQKAAGINQYQSLTRVKTHSKEIIKAVINHLTAGRCL